MRRRLRDAAGLWNEPSPWGGCRCTKESRLPGGDVKKRIRTSRRVKRAKGFLFSRVLTRIDTIPIGPSPAEHDQHGIKASVRREPSAGAVRVEPDMASPAQRMIGDKSFECLSIRERRARRSAAAPIEPEEIRLGSAGTPKEYATQRRSTGLAEQLFGLGPRGVVGILKSR